jgi:hypothetical protein
MLELEQIKSFIIHPEPIIHNAALEYFADSFLWDEELMRLVLQSMKVNPLETMHLFNAYRFPQTPDTLQALFAMLEEATPYDNWKYHIEAIIANSDLNYLQDCSEKLKYLLASFQKKINQRIQLTEMKTEMLWREWDVLCETGKGKYINEFDSVYGDLIIEELAKRADVDQDRVIEGLKRSDAEDTGYQRSYLAKMAGELRLAESVPFLIPLLGDYNDVLSENVGDALVRIGTVEVIENIEQKFSEEEWDFCLFAAGVLGRIKRQESEQAIMRLLPVELDLGIATNLADGLCKLLCKEGIPLVVDQIKQGYDTMMLSLEESLYVNCTMNDVPFPFLGHSNQRMREDHSFLGKEMEKYFASMKNSRNAKLEMTGTSNRYGLSAQKPYTKAENIGRNDPCSCGSAKKYKKCCGK